MRTFHSIWVQLILPCTGLYIFFVLFCIFFKMWCLSISAIALRPIWNMLQNKPFHVSILDLHISSVLPPSLHMANDKVDSDWIYTVFGKEHSKVTEYMQCSTIDNLNDAHLFSALAAFSILIPIDIFECEDLPAWNNLLRKNFWKLND